MGRRLLLETVLVIILVVVMVYAYVIIDTRPITLWVGSWNVNASKVWNGEDLSDWMRLRKDDEQFFEINDVILIIAINDSSYSL